MKFIKIIAVNILYENHCFETYDKHTAIMNSAEYIDAITKTINLLYGVNLDEIQLTNPFKFI